MDVLNQLAKSINKNVSELPTKLLLGYVDKDKPLSLYAQPGSKILEEDYDGNQEKLLPFEIAFKTQDLAKGNAVMYAISTYLDNLDHLDTDGSYTVQSLDIDPQPFLTTIDVADNGLFLLDFSLTIYTQKTTRSFK
ncbi:MAG: hypothetical protein [Caudoviricetes sp.]|nr:MAG: hypothetical protein [Caudoviricetes sp.]